MNDLINNLSGNVLGIGLDEKLSKLLYKNKKINNCDLLDIYTSGNKEKGKCKKISIKKIRKKYKNLDYVICNYKVIEKYFNTFIYDSIGITKNKIYYYNVPNDNTLNKYKRYNSIIINNKDFIEIDNSQSKLNIFKKIYYRFIDFINRAIELIGDILMS